MTPLKLFIGFDSKEASAFAVLTHSLLTRSSVPLAITPLALTNLRRIYTRKRGPTESTEIGRAHV